MYEDFGTYLDQFRSEKNPRLAKYVPYQKFTFLILSGVTPCEANPGQAQRYYNLEPRCLEGKQFFFWNNGTFLY